jgi:hypothetical protein
MSQLVHPAYLHEIKEVDGGKPISSEDIASLGPIVAKKAIDWAIVRQYLRSRYLPFVTGIGVSLATVLTIGLVPGAGSQGAPDVAKASLENGSLVALERIEREMELMKKIVSGLVQSVQTLSKEGALKETDVLIEGPFPIPVEVTAPNAALRKEGGRSATVVADVTKGTVLLAHGSSGGWLKVSTPKGETAWVSQGLVAEKKTWR